MEAETPGDEHWLAAYALGIAFSPLDDEAASSAIADVGPRPEVVARARRRLREFGTADGAACRRADLLLERARQLALR